MEKIIVNGGKSLNGSINISGMKNSALPILYATVLVKGTSIIENVPDTEDIRTTYTILRSLGASVKVTGPTSVEINTDSIKEIHDLPTELTRKLRASYYLLGAGIGRFGTVRVGYPGGCAIGVALRPIDQHLAVFHEFGVETRVENGYIITSVPNGLSSTSFSFSKITVGATINAMLSAVLIDGNTTLINCAREPHIVDLANYLNKCGAHISGAGTPTIKIRGVKSLTACSHDIAPDMIEAGTYMVAVAAAGGKVDIKNVIPEHLETVTLALRQAGVEVIEHDDYITVIRDPEKSLRPILVVATAYPGFPTDMQPQICTLTCVANGISRIEEKVWDNRFIYVEELLRMGANISVLSSVATVTGVPYLSGASVKAPDLRGGAALVIAGLFAKGTTEISEIQYIERGYDDIVAKLKGVGADIRRINI